MVRSAAFLVLALTAAGCAALFGIDELTYQPATAGGGSANGGQGGATTSSSGSGGGGAGGGAGGQGGKAPPTTPLDCLDALELGQSTGDGVYTVDPDGEMGPNEPLQVFCDMTTAGGGWTLVWVYQFTHYGNFNGSGNAVTPRPSWPLSVGDSVAVSTTTPLSLTDYNAMDFDRWKDFGSDVLFESNITHWLHCTPNPGSLVDNVGGSMTCAVVMNVASVCLDNAPDVFVSSTDSGCRPALQQGGKNYICWDGRTNNNWPTHDACGSNSPNQVQGLPDPHGAIFLRRLPR